MKALLRFIRLLSVSVIGIATVGPSGAAESTSATVFRKLEQFYKDMGAERLDAAMTLYAADAEVILPGQSPVVGASAIRSWWASTLSEYEFRVSPELVEAADLGDGVMLRGRAFGKFVSKKDGSALNIDSWFVQIYRRQPNGTYLFWRGASGANPTK